MTKQRAFDRAAVAAYCRKLPGARATRPFGPEPLVFKVTGKIFALLGGDPGSARVSLKCDPDRSLLLRSSYAAITPGYHLNKEHWNTIALDGTVPVDLVRELIDHAYALVNRPKRKPSRARRAPRRRTPRSRSARR